MSKQGEINYPFLLGADNLADVARKPFSTQECSKYLMRIGAVMDLLPQPPARLLDLGCGTGWTSFFLAQRGYHVTGIDISPAMIDVAESLRRESGLDNLRFVKMDYEDADFTDEFDCALFFDSLHHAVDEAAALGAAYRALRPGGVCVTSEPGVGHGETEESRYAKEAFDVTEKDMPPGHIIEVGKRVGFRSARVFPDALQNLMVPYQRKAGLAKVGGPSSDPCRDSGLFKRCFHRFIRWRWGLRSHAYAGLISYLPMLLEIIESRLGRQGVVVLEK